MLQIPLSRLWDIMIKYFSFTYAKMHSALLQFRLDSRMVFSFSLISARIFSVYNYLYNYAYKIL